MQCLDPVRWKRQICVTLSAYRIRLSYEQVTTSETRSVYKKGRTRMTTRFNQRHATIVALSATYRRNIPLQYVRKRSVKTKDQAFKDVGQERPVTVCIDNRCCLNGVSVHLVKRLELEVMKFRPCKSTLATTRVFTIPKEWCKWTCRYLVVLLHPERSKP